MEALSVFHSVMESQFRTIFPRRKSFLCVKEQQEFKAEPLLPKRSYKTPLNLLVEENRTFMRKFSVIILLALSMTSCLGKRGNGEAGSSTPEDPWGFYGADTASTLSSTSIQVSWTAATGTKVIGYNLYRVEGNNLIFIENFPGGSTSHTLSSLTPNTVYRYIVKAIDSENVEDPNTKVVSTTTSGSDTLTGVPTSKELMEDSSFTFSAIGGSSPYTYSILAGPGSVNSSTGEFTAPSLPSTTTLMITDANSDVAIIAITTVPDLVLSPAYILVNKNANFTFQVTGGVSPYAFTLITGVGSINSSTGVYSSSTAGNAVIKVTDSAGYAKTASINVYDGQRKIRNNYNTTCLIDEYKQLKCFGHASVYGFLLNASGGHVGDQSGEMGDNLTPLGNLGTGRTVVSASFSTNTGCFLLDNFTVKCVGYSYELGYATGQTNTFFGTNAASMGDSLGTIDWGTGRTAKTIMAHGLQTCAILDNDKVKCFGYNANGSLGIGESSNIYVGYNTGDMGDAMPYAELGTGRTAKSLSMSTYSVCVLLDNDRVKCWGDGSYGNLGNESTTSIGTDPAQMGDSLAYVDLGTGRTVKKLSKGGHAFRCAVLDNDRVKCWGRGNRGSLGLGLGNLIHMGDDAGEMGDSLAYVDLGTGRTAKNVVTGQEHACAHLDNDYVKCWGNNQYGAVGSEVYTYYGDGGFEMGDNLAYVDLGTGRTVKKIVASYDGNCAILDNDKVKCWGKGAGGVNGLGTGQDRGLYSGDMGDNLPYIDIGTGRTATDIFTSAGNVCVVRDDASIVCWGYNAFSKLGVPDETYLVGETPSDMGSNLQAMDLGANVQVQDVAIGEYHICALTTDFQVKCWGEAGTGRLGNESGSDVGDSPDELGNSLVSADMGTTSYPVMITAGNHHSCALFANGRVKCWGEDANGALGNESLDYTTGDAAGEMGDNLPFIDLGTTDRVTHLGTGYRHNCVLFETGKVKCWGYNSSGQLGLEDTDHRGDDPNEMGSNLPYLDFGSGRTATQLSVGFQHNCVLLDDGAVKCWGYQNAGQLGIGSFDTIGDGPGEMGYTNLVDFGTGLTVSTVYAGIERTCLQFDDHRMKCFGKASGGFFGNGVTDEIGEEAGDMGNNMPFMDFGTNVHLVDISVAQTACGIRSDGAFVCWGVGNYGQRGSGDTDNYGDTIYEDLADLVPIDYQ
jgi:alpha-tubulin suppressor-like RCC1 family protein